MMTAKQQRMVSQAITEFNRQCEAVECTDTGGVWDLFRWIQNMIDEPEHVRRVIVPRVKKKEPSTFEEVAAGVHIRVK